MIAVPVFSKKSIVEDIKKANALADIIELRVDLMGKVDITSILRKIKKPVIVTNRKKSDGGAFGGTEAERISVLKKAIAAGADYVDVELSTPKKLFAELIKSKGNTKIICSYHNFRKTPFGLKRVYRKIIKTGCDITKIATHANSVNDNLKIFEVIAMAKKEKREIIAFCMGERGQPSRILATRFGSMLTFGSLNEGKESAPGQLNAGVLKDIYRVNDLNQNTKIYGLIGNPVKESKGYLLHNQAYGKIKSNSIYVPFPVEDVKSFVRGFGKIMGGFSVTMPHKREVMKFLNTIEPTAKKIGAVNTVINNNGKLIGSNTDCSGAVHAIEEKIRIKGKRVVMLGAGGVARAIAFGIREKGGKLALTDLNQKQGMTLAKECGGEYFPPEDFENKQMDILINATPVGMHPNINRTPFPKEKISKGIVVFDVVYNPQTTRLLREARQRKCKTISGVEMFINQAVGQFELWTKRKAPRKLMRKIVLESLR